MRDFIEQADELESKLRARDYPVRVIARAKKRARNNNREALLEPKIPNYQPKQRLACVTTYNIASIQVSKILNKHWRILTSGSITLEKPLFAFKRGRSIKDSVVHTRPYTQSISNQTLMLHKTTGHYPCGSCSVCPNTKVSKSVDIGTPRAWELKTFSNCNTERVVYLITCPCKKQYVGMTTRKVCTRICEHRSNFKCKKSTTKMAAHYIEANHAFNDFTWVVLEHVPRVDNCESVLFTKEQRWIFRLGTDRHGLNDDIPWSQV